MNVNWMIEKYMFPDYEDKLVETIKLSGSNCYLFDDTDHFKFDFDKHIKHKYTEKDCVIFYGSLQRGRQVYRETNFIPGIFYTVDNYECFKYYGYYGDFLLNKEYLMIGLNDFKRKAISLFTQFETRKLFIRPSNGYKTFPGQILTLEGFLEANEFEIFVKSYGGLDMDQLIVISPYKKIVQESRYLIIDEEIIDGAVYSIDGELVKNVKIQDNESTALVKKCKSMYKPDEIFTIDVAKLNTGENFILEINSFCCAGLYNLDIPTVVNAVNTKVIDYYKDYYNI
jgi:hypothetical protein